MNCSFAYNTINSKKITAVLTIGPTSTAANHVDPRLLAIQGLAFGLVTTLVIIGKRSRVPKCVLLVLLTISLAGIGVGCGGYATKRKTYNVIVKSNATINGVQFQSNPA